MPRRKLGAIPKCAIGESPEQQQALVRLGDMDVAQHFDLVNGEAEKTIDIKESVK